MAMADCQTGRKDRSFPISTGSVLHSISEVREAGFLLGGRRRE
jgi:hypothetical protein